MGSKNAAFYLGKCVKMATKQGSGRYVHELSISAAELEQRYKQGEVPLTPPCHCIFVINKSLPAHALAQRKTTQLCLRHAVMLCMIT